MKASRIHQHRLIDYMIDSFVCVCVQIAVNQTRCSPSKPQQNHEQNYSFFKEKIAIFNQKNYQKCNDQIKCYNLPI